MATTDTPKPTETSPTVENPPKSPAAAPTPDLPVDPPAAGNGSKADSDNPKTAPAAEDASAPAGEAASVIEKKMKPAERFGISVLLTEEEKRNSRAERFGTVPTSKGSDGTKKAEDLKRKARAERFGIAAAAPVVSDEDERKKARLARFTPASKTAAKPDPQEEEKRKARSLRFSNGSAASLSQVNDKGNIEPAAIADEAVGKA